MVKKNDITEMLRGEVPWTPAGLRAFMAFHLVRQVEVAEVLEVGQPRVSGVLTGKVPASRQALARLRQAIVIVLEGRHAAQGERHDHGQAGL